MRGIYPAQGDKSPRSGRPWLMPHYLGATVLARIGDEGARVSLVLLALDRTGSAAIGGTMVAALLIPHVVAAPLVGVLVDRARQPRWVLAAAMLIFGGSLFSAAVLMGHAQTRESPGRGQAPAASDVPAMRASCDLFRRLGR
jgi:MFS family permease